MRIKYRSKFLLLPLLALATTACAQTAIYETPTGPAPFYITFDAKGEPVVLDSKGNRLELEREGAVAEIPTPSTIKRVTQISALEIEGSHYYLLFIGGRFVKIPLPHP